ncbi:hypothetical protein, variant [Verruconis gallopava]|uniref:F-box domain-containing protein n=1 Tax=Verruconis gallopava TaxID=253628 RepID=A0A0D2AI58_9PEZI|nr:hypothetical protein, variant [Verruconis gallopava]KIV98598.1 hypothetical protein, variant [Verruconis gallopava]
MQGGFDGERQTTSRCYFHASHLHQRLVSTSFDSLVPACSHRGVRQGTMSLKERVRDFAARGRESSAAGKSRWKLKPRMLRHVKAAELVSLSRDSSLAKIPAELQLQIISTLEYEDVVQLKRTCRYFNFFINSDVMEESRAAQVEIFRVMEQNYSMPGDKLPCYHCLKLKPKVEFYDVAGKYYLSSPPIGYYRTALYNADTNRNCIRCGFLTRQYLPGLSLKTGNQVWMFCSECGVLERLPSQSSYRYPDNLCLPCSNKYNFFRAQGTTMRLVQWVISIVILPLACTGQFMPWTSKASNHSLRWIFTITLASIDYVVGVLILATANKFFRIC